MLPKALVNLNEASREAIRKFIQFGVESSELDRLLTDASIRQYIDDQTDAML
jgi:hypothetical protein